MKCLRFMDVVDLFSEVGGERRIGIDDQRAGHDITATGEKFGQADGRHVRNRQCILVDTGPEGFIDDNRKAVPICQFAQL